MYARRVATVCMSTVDASRSVRIVCQPATYVALWKQLVCDISNVINIPVNSSYSSF